MSIPISRALVETTPSNSPFASLVSISLLSSGMNPARYELTFFRSPGDNWDVQTWISSAVFLDWVKAIVLKPDWMQKAKSLAAEKLELISGLRKRKYCPDLGEPLESTTLMLSCIRRSPNSPGLLIVAERRINLRSEEHTSELQS